MLGKRILYSAPIKNALAYHYIDVNQFNKGLYDAEGTDNISNEFSVDSALWGSRKVIVRTNKELDISTVDFKYFEK